jgi:outer membrane protein TolC|tara:strand:+ start:3302 stop:4606 length:1305 start_codon:yes stop_codon:yes gene_type:complete
MKQLLTILTLSVWIPFMGISQETMSVEDAIAIAMKHNYDIKLADNSLLQAENNKSIYNTGFLPTVTASANGKYSNSDAVITTQTGQENTINGIETKGYGGSVGLNYILYNGGSRKFQYDKLKIMYDLSDAQKQIQIENTLIDVYTNFYNVARSQEQKATLIEAFGVSKERLERVTVQQQYGKKTQLDILNAKVDANRDSINLLNAGVALENNRRNLNFLLGREINTSFETSKEVVLEENLSYTVLLGQLKSNNNSLKQIEINKTISQQDLSINQAGWLPSVSTSISYGLNYSDNGPAGFLAVQQTTGLNSGLNLSWTVFDGGSTKVRVQNAKINLKTQELNKQKLQLNLENQLAKFWAEYNTQKAIIENEKINIEISNQNFLKSKELFNLGRATSLDFRQAQLNLVNTKLNLLNAKYNAKIAELQLKKFAGLLK